MPQKIDVTFAGDQDVVQHMYGINRCQIGIRSRQKIRPIQLIAKDRSEEEPKEIEEQECRPSIALSDADALLGEDVFQFKTPKKAGQMQQKVIESTTPSRTPKASVPVTPKSTSKKTSVSTPRVKQLKSKRPEAMTPHRLRKRNKQAEAVDSSSDESVSDHESSSDSDGDNDLGISELSAKNFKENIEPTGKKRKKELEVEVDAQGYFHSQDNTITSDHTLSRLDVPRLDQATLRAALARYKHPYAKQLKALKSTYKTMFNKWMFMMGNGYNILLHGLGSKHSLISDFTEDKLSDFSKVIINGYFPTITIKYILNLITADILDYSGSFRNIIEHCEFIKKHYESGEQEDLFLVIHNIDGSMLRSSKVQAVFAMLAQIRGVHIIASVDHINAPLIWDQNRLSAFRWLWYDVTTFESYTYETSYENSLLVQHSESLALSSMIHVVQALTPNAKKIFELIVDYQIANSSEKHYEGMPFSVLYQRTREAFLVNSDQTLKAQLTEFKDHKLLKVKKGKDGMEYLTILLDNATLQEYKNIEKQDS